MIKQGPKAHAARLDHRGTVKFTPRLVAFGGVAKW